MTELTKWPRLLVVGDPVTEAQADEIILRTTWWWNLGCNDNEWTHVVAELAGLDLDNIYDHPIKHSLQAFEKRLGVLDLAYLNNERILSAWIGGPHGWCDWDGTIGCATHNLGKWPSHDEVTGDWQAIATAWPFLSLRAQLVADEADGDVLAQWSIAGGQVTAETPGPLITEPLELDDDHLVRRFAHGGERGVSVERLTQALARFPLEVHA